MLNVNRKMNNIHACLTKTFELARADGAHNVRPMEGMRGFAVILVFLVHFVTLVNPWVSSSSLIELADSIHAIGNTGVDLFFVLSGFLIYGSLIARPQNFLIFMSRRIARIYPTFTVVFAAYFVLSFVFPSESKIPSSINGGLLYLIENFLLLPGLFEIEPMITVAWSLSYEMFYYMAIPFIVKIFNLRNWSVKWRISLFLVLAVVFLIYCALFGGPVRLAMFISGILLYEALLDRKLVVNSFCGFLGLGIGMLAVLLPIAGDFGLSVKTAVTAISFYIFCIACFRDNKVLIARLFAWTPLRWLGNMSYSYYLLHGLVLKAAFLVVAAVLPTDTAYGELIFCTFLLPMFAVTLIPSVGLFIMVERPFSLATKSR